MLSLFVFLIILSILVLVHELGHFLMAKKAGIKVEEFGLGYPPRIFGKKIGETIYSLNWIPFGGFVRLYGEELQAAKKSKLAKRAFWAKSKKARTAVITAGVVGNFFLAVVCFSAVYSASGIPTITNQVKIVGIAKNSPAAKAGLRQGDIVLAVGRQPVENLKHFIKLVGAKKGRPVKLLVKRQNTGVLTLFVTPRKNPPQGEGALGVVISSMEMKKYPFWQMPFRSAVEGFKEAIGWGMLIFNSLTKMLANLAMKGIVPKDVSGPLGIFQVTAGVAHQGILAILQLMGVLSVNLAILNILPFPALDGGRLVFIAYEAITRRRPRPSIEHWVNLAGMAILLSLIILVTVNDIERLVGVSALSARFRAFWPF